MTCSAMKNLPGLWRGMVEGRILSAERQVYGTVHPPLRRRAGSCRPDIPVRREIHNKLMRRNAHQTLGKAYSSGWGSK